DDELGQQRFTPAHWLGLFSLLFVAGKVGMLLNQSGDNIPAGEAPANAAALSAEGFGTVEVVGDALFRQHLVPFELTAILLLVAVVGAVARGHRAGPLLVLVEEGHRQGVSGVLQRLDLAGPDLAVEHPGEHNAHGVSIGVIGQLVQATGEAVQGLDGGLWIQPWCRGLGRRVPDRDIGLSLCFGEAHADRPHLSSAGLVGRDRVVGQGLHRCAVHGPGPLQIV
ncbi:MAG: NADH-quinone oxidoreductase subunit J, partial [Proteobacteria bacterium]|nr:NADH-quinone oxidoreductase subunit J [Pseudomonadota bacterium]